MLTANKCMPTGTRLAPVLLKRAPTITLDWDVRQKSRFDATDSSGRSIGVFLPRGTVVRGGDVLVVEDGSLVRVLSAPQKVLHISHCPQHGSLFDLTRAAYHLGNRHVPIELQSDHLKIEPDHVLADMLRAMHLIVREDELPFEPEGGAYSAQGHGHTHGHAHAHAHGQDHAQENDKEQDSAHAHGSKQGPAHGHGRDCDHEHKRGHGHGPDSGHDHGPGHGHARE